MPLSHDYMRRGSYKSPNAEVMKTVSVIEGQEGKVSWYALESLHWKRLERHTTVITTTMEGMIMNGGTYREHAKCLLNGKNELNERVRDVSVRYHDSLRWTTRSA